MAPTRKGVTAKTSTAGGRGWTSTPSSPPKAAAPLLRSPSPRPVPKCPAEGCTTTFSGVNVDQALKAHLRFMVDRGRDYYEKHDIDPRNWEMHRVVQERRELIKVSTEEKKKAAQKKYRTENKEKRAAAARMSQARKKARDEGYVTVADIERRAKEIRQAIDAKNRERLLQLENHERNCDYLGGEYPNVNFELDEGSQEERFMGEDNEPRHCKRALEAARSPRSGIHLETKGLGGEEFDAVRAMMMLKCQEQVPPMEEDINAALAQLQGHGKDTEQAP